MNDTEKLKHCAGCRDNFYNGNNPFGVKRCWMLEQMKLIPRKKIGTNDRPPWNWKPETYPNCYTQEGYVFRDGDNANKTGW